MNYDELEYGESIPGVVCPVCGGELVHTSAGALCDWCCAYVPVVGAVLTVDEPDDDLDTDDDDEGDEW